MIQANKGNLMVHLHYSQIKKCFKDHSEIKKHEDHIYQITEKINLNSVELQPGFYFIDEVWVDFVGPYVNQESCQEAFINYKIRLEGASS